MKRYLCLLLAMVILLLSLSLAACDKASTADEDKKDEITVPDGYTLYDDGKISFAYPEDWEESDGSVAMLMNPTGAGNNITIVYEAKTDMYEKMTLASFNENMKPSYEAMGMTLSNIKVEQTENDAGTKITKLSYNATMSGVSMKQTAYVTTVGSRTYSVTVTETTSDATLVKNVFNTLVAVK